MKSLDIGTYADLKQKRRLVVAQPRCHGCARQGFTSATHTAQHNEQCARTGERVYRIRRAA